MRKEHIFRMHFLPNGKVALYEEVGLDNNKTHLEYIATYSGVVPARVHARYLCKQDCTLRLLNIQAHHLKEIESN